MMMLINLKKITLAFSLIYVMAVSTSVFAQSTFTVTDTTTNTTYNLSILTGAWTNTSVASTLQSQPWWNNASLAQRIAGLSGNLWGNSYFPLVAYNAPVPGGGGRSYVSIQYWETNAYNTADSTGVANTWNGAGGYINNCVTNCPTTTNLWDWIIALGYTPATGPSTINTNQSLSNTAQVLQGTVTLQNAVMVNSFTYDCSVFDKHDVCVSAGGRNTTVQAEGINNTNALLIASYRLDKNNSRFGVYADQNLSTSGPGAVQLGNNTPMLGLFGVWSERPDEVGAEVKLSAAYGQKSTTVTRGVVGSGSTASEAGSGGSNLTSQGVQAVAKYGFGVMQDVVVSPYAGIRYTQNNLGGYTESSSASVTAPLTYGQLNTNATTALAGAEAKYRGIPLTTLFASAGVETDTNTANGSYNATNASIGALNPVNFNPNPVKTRPTASVGAYYDVAKNQRLGVTGIYRQEAYQAVSTTTVMATYTVGI